MKGWVGISTTKLMMEGEVGGCVRQIGVAEELVPGKEIKQTWDQELAGIVTYCFFHQVL